MIRTLLFLLVSWPVLPLIAAAPCRVIVVDRENKWPVPLVELRTTNQIRYVSDNAGVIAIDDPDLFGQETWFGITGHGYSVKPDGFGYRGVIFTPLPGKTITVEVIRENIAKRIGRLTGRGLYAQSQKCGLELDWNDSDIVGCDSVQTAVLGEKRFWLWGDTTLARYPLGIFDASAATTPLQPWKEFQPPLRPNYDYFRTEKGQPRPVAKMPGTGPTWVFGVATVPDAAGTPKLVGHYTKIQPPLTPYECGLCVWNEANANFEQLKVVWTKKDSDRPPLMPDGNAVKWKDIAGKEWLLFGNPLPHLRCPATFEAWQDPTQWERLQPARVFTSDTGREIEPHTGCIGWHPWRKKWVAVFLQRFGQPSPFGEIWYAEADSPLGPWGTAVKVLTHDNYTFYNPRLHIEMSPADSPVLLFEGTYTAEFAKSPPITPRHNYNQILYRLDLDDPRLAKAKE